MLSSITTKTVRRGKALNTKSLEKRFVRSNLKKIIAERMKLARELNGYQQTEAADKFGYRKSTQLSLWESGSRIPPIDMIIDASQIYRVSIDYLLGQSDEPDRDPRSAEHRAVLQATEQMLMNMAHGMTDAIMAQAKAGGPAVLTAQSIIDDAERFLGAFERFVELNMPRFMGMRGGNTAVTSAEAFKRNGLTTAKKHLERYTRQNPEEVHKATKDLDTRTKPLFPIDPHSD